MKEPGIQREVERDQLLDEKDRRRGWTCFDELLGDEEGVKVQENRRPHPQLLVEVLLGDEEGEWDRWRLRRKEEEEELLDEGELDRTSPHPTLQLPAADLLASGDGEEEWVRSPYRDSR